MSEIGTLVSRIQFSDPDGLVGAICGGQLEPWVLGGHRAESEMSRIMLPGSCLDQAELGSAMWFRGEMPKDCYTMIYVDACPQDGHSFNFNTRHRDQCLGFFAPGEILDATTPSGYRHGTLTIPASVFHQAAESRYPEFTETFLKRGRSIFPDADACRNVSALLGGIMETIRRDPDTLAGEATRAALESELHERFFDLLRNDRTNPMVEGNPRIARRYQRLKLLRDFIRENTHRPIRMDELCAVSGLSRRGMEYLFMDLLGVGVSPFLHHLRLHGVRRELLATDPRHGSVKRSALDWGFWHLGRFAADYRLLFGENPSETLSGPPEAWLPVWAGKWHGDQSRGNGGR
jgi:AraC-like DNA-binding protein